MASQESETKSLAKPAKKKKKRGKLIITALIILALIGAGVAWFLNKPSDTQDVVATGDVHEVTPRDITTSVTVNGKVSSAVTEDVYTMQPAPIAEISVEVGDKVQQYQTVARLDTTQVNRQIQTDEAALAAAKAAGEEDTTALQTAVDNSYADKNASVLTAPINGIVAEIQSQVGAPAAGAIMTIADDSRLVIKGSIKEEDVAKVTTGQKVRFTTATTGDKEFTGAVNTISPIAEQPSMTDAPAPSPDVTFPIEIIVEGDTADLRIGSTAKAQVILDESLATIAVPRDAILTEEDGTSHVLTLVDDPEGQTVVEKQEVELGARDNFYVTVTSDNLEGKVLDRAATYRELVGKPVMVVDAEQGM
ncbi:HlyD family efflux transporter periplasmic adaptor subunit [Corynebacterium breve]|uniref:HlyD family efflux transporter periplasmic adaptor subunit n=1 Tax=Corynebacterium breve TaxID=3049799 RepID=A0ABY8VD97_9CORY|nr:HlyD family efflux transporter periplasmic adaptor subunit [Corynebacterium breve]WIM67468.1 HlyD family efflux transporter periplasmic adaptor subunit [Corynebacterium breve]